MRGTWNDTPETWQTINKYLCANDCAGLSVGFLVGGDLFDNLLQVGGAVVQHLGTVIRHLLSLAHGYVHSIWYAEVWKHNQE